MDLGKFLRDLTSWPRDLTQNHVDRIRGIIPIAGRTFQVKYDNLPIWMKYFFIQLIMILLSNTTTIMDDG
jgi:hypothetical protein